MVGTWGEGTMPLLVRIRGWKEENSPGGLASLGGQILKCSVESNSIA